MQYSKNIFVMESISEQDIKGYSFFFYNILTQ